MAAAVAVTVRVKRGPDDELTGKVANGYQFHMTSCCSLFSDTAAIPPPSSLSSGPNKPQDKNEEKDG